MPIKNKGGAESLIDKEKAATRQMNRFPHFPTHKKQENHSKVNLFLDGEYPLSGNNFQIRECKMIIRQRKNPTESKPLLFISQVKPSYKYITSLYPTSKAGVYSVDYEGFYYLVSLSEESIIFRSTNV